MKNNRAGCVEVKRVKSESKAISRDRAAEPGLGKNSATTDRENVDRYFDIAARNLRRLASKACAVGPESRTCRRMSAMAELATDVETLPPPSAEADDVSAPPSKRAKDTTPAEDDAE